MKHKGAIRLGSTMILGILVLLLPLAVHGNSALSITGAHFSNNIAVDGTVHAELQLSSHTAVSTVLLSYSDRSELVVNASMSLLQGSSTNGWWAATIEPAIAEQDSGGVAAYHFLPMNIFVSGPNGVVELRLDPSILPSWSVEIRTSQTTPAFRSSLPLAIMEISGLFLLAGGVSVAGVFHYGESSRRNRVRAGET